VILKETLSGDRSSLTSESESEMFLEDLPLRKRPVKSPFLDLAFSSSSELEESSLEKSKSLRAAHAQDMIFWIFFFFFFFFFKAALLLVVALVAGVISVGVVIFVEGVELLPLEAVDDEVGGVTALKAAHR
jgi:fatty acid desaturase